VALSKPGRPRHKNTCNMAAPYQLVVLSRRRQLGDLVNYYHFFLLWLNLSLLDVSIRLA
jgi:hypothetical protein